MALNLKITFPDGEEYTMTIEAATRCLVEDYQNEMGTKSATLKAVSLIKDADKLQKALRELEFRFLFTELDPCPLWQNPVELNQLAEDWKHIKVEFIQDSSLEVLGF